jgi:hypothetical protein
MGVTNRVVVMIGVGGTVGGCVLIEKWVMRCCVTLDIIA